MLLHGNLRTMNLSATLCYCYRLSCWNFHNHRLHYLLSHSRILITPRRVHDCRLNFDVDLMKMRCCQVRVLIKCLRENNFLLEYRQCRHEESAWLTHNERQISRVLLEKDGMVNFASVLENYSLPIERISSTVGAINSKSSIRNIDKIESTMRNYGNYAHEWFDLWLLSTRWLETTVIGSILTWSSTSNPIIILPLRKWRK